MLKLSLITINLNNVLGLRKTIESVVSQTFTGYEYIIIDGGSTDGSVEIIQEFRNKVTYWASEPDEGIYNAMNKGIKVATGEYCLFLNSGDWLLKENVLELIFFKNYKEDLVCCKLYKHDHFCGGLIQIPKEKFTFYDFYISSLSHPSTFIKRELFVKNGLYDENLKIVADWKFFIESVIIHKCSYVMLDAEITYFESEGISKTHYWQGLKERELILEEIFPYFMDDYRLLHRYKSSRLIKLYEKWKANTVALSVYKFLLDKILLFLANKQNKIS